MRPSDDTIAKAIGYTLCAAAIAAGAYIFQPVQDPVSTVPVPAATEAPFVAPTTEYPMPTGPVYGPAQDCGDGTYGTFAECWRRSWDEVVKSAAAVPPPTGSALPVYRGTVCRDGWLSSSTGSGTCSHHGGEG